MTSQTLSAIKAIVETDTTLSDIQRAAIIHFCEQGEQAKESIPRPRRFLTARRVAETRQISVRTVWRLVGELEAQAGARLCEGGVGLVSDLHEQRLEGIREAVVEVVHHRLGAFGVRGAGRR